MWNNMDGRGWTSRSTCTILDYTSETVLIKRAWNSGSGRWEMRERDK